MNLNSSKLEAALSVDLLSVCEQAGAQFHKEGGAYRSHCPLHGGDGKSNFAVYQDGGKQKWKCYSGSCGNGDVIDFVTTWRGCGMKEAIEYLTDGKDINPVQAAQMATERKARAEQHKAKKEEEYKEALAELRQAKAWERYYQNLLENDHARYLWQQRGIPAIYQQIWQLGYADKFRYRSNEGVYVGPSLVIPIFSIGNPEPVNIRHRILNPINPADKYRPERPGLVASPFIADPSKEHERVLVVEGEIKAMVSYITLDDTKLQIYGIPGKSQFKSLVPKLAGKDVYILFDPDAKTEAIEASKMVGGKAIFIRRKIDDAILAGKLDKSDIERMMNSARKAKM